MSKFKPIMAALASLPITSIVLAGAYAWALNGDGNWNWGPNWSLNPPFCQQDCYPHTTNDDATIAPVSNNVPKVTLESSQTIDDLIISGRAEFDLHEFTTSDGNTKTITADSIIIASAYVRVENKAALKTN